MTSSLLEIFYWVQDDPRIAAIIAITQPTTPKRAIDLDHQIEKR